VERGIEETWILMSTIISTMCARRMDTTGTSLRARIASIPGRRGPNGKSDPHPVLADQDASIGYQLVADSGTCVQHGIPQCLASHDGFPITKYPNAACQFHVEWTQAVAAEASEEKVGCDSTPEVPDETLWLEVVQMNIENAKFNEFGYFSGERLEVNDVNTKTSMNTDTQHQMATFIQVKDKSVIKWTTDESVQEQGWLVCLRQKKKLPTTHVATCSEIGDDIWSLYFTQDNPTQTVSVECDMTKCNKAAVSSVEGRRYSFLRTINVCDAGWQASRSSKFEIEFKSATSTLEPIFDVLL